MFAFVLKELMIVVLTEDLGSEIRQGLAVMCCLDDSKYSCYTINRVAYFIFSIFHVTRS